MNRHLASIVLAIIVAATACGTGDRPEITDQTTSSTTTTTTSVAATDLSTEERSTTSSVPPTTDGSYPTMPPTSSTVRLDPSDPDYPSVTFETIPPPTYPTTGN